MNQSEQRAVDRAKRITVCLVFAIVWFGPASAPAQTSDYAERMRTATEEVNRGDFSAAMADLEAAVRLEPGNAAGWYEMGVLYGQIGDFRNAETAFRRTLQLNPDLAKGHYMLGLSLIANPKSKLDWPGAIAEFQAAIKLQPNYPEALNYLGAGLIAVGHPDQAIPELERAVLLAPELSSAHFNLAIALEDNNKLHEAEQEYRNAIAAKGGYAEANSALGKLLFRMGQGAEADKELRKALQLNPDLQDAHYALGRVLQSQKKSAEAKIEFEEAVALGKREPDAIESSQLSNSAMATASKGDMVGAETSLRRAILLRPDFGVPHYNLGLILADKGDLDGASQQLTLAISLLPVQAKPWFDLGRVQRLQGRQEDALASLSWAARLAPSDLRIQSELRALRTGDGAAVTPVAAPSRRGALSDTAAEHFAFAKELDAQGDLLGVIGELLRSLALEPAAFEVRSYLAASYERLGDLNQATLEYQKILLAAPNNVESHLALGRMLLAQHRPGEAVEEFRQALKYRPDSAEARKALDEVVLKSQKQ